jgi:long-chain acyl-CoA synthetase
VGEVALGLVDLGIEPGERVSILSHTRPEWTYACFATFAAGASVVAIYQTNSAQECHYVLHHSGARAVFVEDAEQLAKVRAVEADLPELEFVIVIESADANGSTISLDALRERGRGRAQDELEERVGAATPDAECLLLYTSGTTGPPKACQLTHGNYRAVTSAVETRDLVREDDTVYVFLPLAHALALVVQFLVLDVGATIAYWEKDPQKIVANLMELKPTFFPSVPRIFEKIHTLATSGGDARELEQATRVGVAVRQAQRRGEEVPAELQPAVERAEQDLYVNVRNLFGGRVRQAVTGAAPIAPSILEFFYACGVPVMEGYGMTETASVASVNTPDAFRFGSVGRPLPGVQVRIADNDGIVIKGPNIFTGYYRDAEATLETMVDGWLQTGDLGRLDEDGFLFITGREKDIIITAGGKNIAPANLEHALQRNRWISHAVVIGDGRPYLVALITLDADETPAFASQHNLKPDEVHRSESMRAEIQTAIDEVNGTCQLALRARGADQALRDPARGPLPANRRAHPDAEGQTQHRPAEVRRDDRSYLPQPQRPHRSPAASLRELGGGRTAQRPRFRRFRSVQRRSSPVRRSHAASRSARRGSSRPGAGRRSACYEGCQPASRRLHAQPQRAASDRPGSRRSRRPGAASYGMKSFELGAERLRSPAHVDRRRRLLRDAVG